MNTAKGKLRTVEVDTCGSCPFLSQTGFSNSCGRMPYVMEKDGFPKYGVNDSWQVCPPKWCPLRKASFVVSLNEKRCQATSQFGQCELARDHTGLHVNEGDGWPGPAKAAKGGKR